MEKGGGPDTTELISIDLLHAVSAGSGSEERSAQPS